jgi:hypothetical protein
LVHFLQIVTFIGLDPTISKVYWFSSSIYTYQ